MNPLPATSHPRRPRTAACTTCFLRGGTFQGILEDVDLDLMQTHASSVQLEAGQTLYQGGRTGSAVYTLRVGIMCFERVNERGERRIVRLAGRGDLLGQEVLLTGSYAEDAIACTAVSLCCIPTPVVTDLGAREPALFRELMMRWQRVFEDSQTWVAELVTGPARRRVLKLLAMLANFTPPDTQIWLPPRDKMGAMLNLTIETASRQISQLRREGVLISTGLRWAHLDRQALEEALRQQDRSS